MCLWERIYMYIFKRASLVAQMVKIPPAMQETWVWCLGWEDPLKKEMATHSSVLAWRIPWIASSVTDWLVMEEDWLQFMGLQRCKGLDMTEQLTCEHAHTHTHTHTQGYVMRRWEGAQTYPVAKPTPAFHHQILFIRKWRYSAGGSWTCWPWFPSVGTMLKIQQLLFTLSDPL